VKRYLRLYGTMVRASLQREIEFRANFWAKIVQNIIWLGFFFLIVKVLYSQTTSIAGWNEGRMFLLVATVYMMSAVVAAVFGMSVVEIPTLVRMGTLDYVLVKPVDSQFWVSVRLFSFDQIGSILASVGLLIYGINTGNVGLTATNFIMYVCLSAAAIVLFYAFQLAMMTLGIWLVRVENLWVLGESVFQVARFPIDVFPRGLQVAFIYYVPLAFIATIPTRALWGDVSPTLFWLGLAWAAVGFLLSRAFWRFALRYYTSASS